MSPTSNIAASIHQRILNKATAEKRPFNELLQYYAIERFLYRLGQSPYFEQFVLKGALVFLAWQTPLTRPTRDMDFLGFMENSVDNLVRVVREICEQPVEMDGMIFESGGIEGETIQEEGDYQGVRISFLGFLGKAQIHMRLDVGFADIVTPSPNELEIPTMLVNMGKPCIRAYPPETVIAEKFQAMISLGMINSRIKDFYDLWYMAKSMEFDFNLLRGAVFNTFQQRNTPLPKELPTSLTPIFASQKQPLWISFIKKSKLSIAPANLIDIIQVISTFFDPIIFPREKLPIKWKPELGWTE
jgi:hypothetical protein